MQEDKCGYGCSDHASWYRQGYPTVIPFEAGFATMNPNLHTENDTVNERIDFKHSAIFAKFALGLAMDLASSQERAPAP
jgi:leucyl aminopeptidase